MNRTAEAGPGATDLAGEVSAAARRLRDVSATPALDAELLMAHVLGLSRTALIARGREAPGAAASAVFSELVDRRAGGEPVAYLTGSKEFWSLTLSVTPAVLIPRPDTEVLVQWALEFLEDRARPHVLDLGTGSGAIALALAREFPGAAVVATDASGAALEVARANAARLEIRNVGFREGGWFGALDPGDGPGAFDLIVSNPPYVGENDPHLAGLAFEPRAALVAADGGLAALRAIAAQAPAFLRPGGALLLEHAPAQAPAVRACVEAAGFVDVGTRCDLAGHERATGGRLP